MFAIRMLVTLAILVPAWIIWQPHETLQIFILALVAFGAGHLVEAVVKSQRRPPTDKPK